MAGTSHELPSLLASRHALPRVLPDRSTMAQLARQTVAVVLAGGRGSRLGPLTEGRAKPAVPFGGKFRIIDFALSNCINSGIRRIEIATQYHSHGLINHVQKGWSFLDGRFNEFIELLPAQQGANTDWYKGTADAVYQNIDVLRRHDPRLVLVLAGDHVYKMDYTRMLYEHADRGAHMTVGCVEVPVDEAAGQLGVMEVDEEFRVIGFQEKPQSPRTIPGRAGTTLGSMGIYVFDADFLYDELVEDALAEESGHDFGHDLIPRLIAREAKVYAHRLRDSCAQLTDSEPLLARRGNRGRVLGSQHRAHARHAGVEPLRPVVADLDLPGAASARQVRLRPRGPARRRHRLHGLRRLHRERLHAAQFPALLERAHPQLLHHRRGRAAARRRGGARRDPEARGRRPGHAHSAGTVGGHRPRGGPQALPRDGQGSDADHLGDARPAPAPSPLTQPESRAMATLTEHDTRAGMLTEHDIYLFREGTHAKLYRKLGCHLAPGGGAHFAVWAPNAKAVSVIGDWNGWRPGADVLSPRWDHSGIWEVDVAAVQPGHAYKYAITTVHGSREDRADPIAFFAELAPRTASRAWALDYDVGRRRVDGEAREEERARCAVHRLRAAPRLVAPQRERRPADLPRDRRAARRVRRHGWASPTSS